MTFLIQTVVICFLVCGVKSPPRTYSNREHAQVKLLEKQLESSKTENPYDYCHLPYEVLGREPADDSFENSLYKELHSQIEMKFPEACERFCQQESDEAKKTSKAVDKEHNVHWSITFGDQYNLLKLCPSSVPHEDKDLLEEYGLMTELMSSIVEGVHPNALDEEIEGPSVKFQKSKAMVLNLMNTIFITIQVLTLTLGVFLMLRALQTYFGGFYFSLLTAITVVLGGANSNCTPLKLGPPFSRMVSSSLNGKLLGGGPTEKWFSSASSGDEQAILRLLTSNPTLLNAKDNSDYGNTALHKAARYNREAVARVLLEHGADINAQGWNKRTPLHHAARDNSEAVARVLLEQGADINAQDKGKWTPLQWAARDNSEAVARVLLEHGADPNAQNENKWTPLHRAAHNNSEAVARVLLEHGADPNAQDEWEKTPLHEAQTDAMRTLLQSAKTVRAQWIKAEQSKKGCFFPVWVMPKKDFKALKRIPSFEEARKKGWIVILPAEKERKCVVFLSHRWLSDTHPDNKENIKLRGVQTLLENRELEDVELIWMDFFSIPQAQDNKQEQLQAINSLPYYVRQCQEFVTLIGVSNVLNANNLDEASMEVYESRGWCRLERLAAVSPVIDWKTNKRMMAARLWVYNMASPSLDDAPFSYAQEECINPLEGEFRDGDSERIRISQMVFHLCEHIEQNSGKGKEIQRSLTIKQTAQMYMSKGNAEKISDNQIYLQSNTQPPNNQVVQQHNTYVCTYVCLNDDDTCCLMM